MKKYQKAFILLGVLIVVAVAVYFITDEKVIYNEGYVNGNTAGNLYNGGMMCEHNGTIFFANPNDSNKLYSMDVDGQNLKKLCDDTANYINVDDNYVYYVRNNVGDSLDYEFFSFYRNALCRIPRDGGKATILDTDPCNYASLIGNYIYYLHYDTDEASTLYKVKIDGTDRQQVRKEAVYTCSTDGQYFYYSSLTGSGDIYQFDTTTDSSSLVLGANSFKPTTQNSGSDFYYIDGDQNNSLVHCSFAGNSIPITNDSVDAYNLYGDYIYYQKYDANDSGLCVVKTDGTGYQFIKAGNFKNIYVTEYYVFFTAYDDSATYYILRSDPTNVLTFNPDVIKK